MRKYSNKELHEKVNALPELKQRAQELIFGAPTSSIEEWTERQNELIGIFSEAVGCKKAAEAMELAEKIRNYILNSPISELKIEVVEKMANDFLEQRKCCSPRGSDYVCFCDKEEDLK